MNHVAFFSRIKCTAVLLLLFLIDIGPVPVTAMLGLFIVVFRPRWFKELVDQIYATVRIAGAERDE
ncbi:MAG: hypothetical protein ACU84J_14765 [Gammaproteobacteria bacterium]